MASDRFRIIGPATQMINVFSDTVTREITETICGEWAFCTNPEMVDNIGMHTPTTIQFHDVLQSHEHAYEFVNSRDLKIMKSGVYSIQLETCFINNSNNQESLKSWFCVNNEIVPYSVNYTFHRNHAAGTSGSTTKCYIKMNKDDILSFHVISMIDDTSCSIHPQGTRVSISRVSRIQDSDEIHMD